MAELFLGLDVGTQATKALLVDTERGIIGRAATGYGLIEGLPAGAAEQHPDTWIAAVREVAARVLAGHDAGRVAGVGVSGQQHGFVALDSAGAVLRPAKLWCDTSTSAEAARLGVPTGFTASKILWLKEHEPESFARLATVLLPHDYVNFRLTGVLCMEPGDASGTGFFDAVAGRFDPAAMARIDVGLADRLPPLRQPGELAGRVSAEGASLLGVREGVPVSTGGGDNMMSAVGSGAVVEGIAVLSLGTSGTIFCRTDSPPFDPSGLIAPFCGSVGGWLPLLCVMNLTGVTEEVVRATGLDHATLTARATAVPIGCGGVTWLPFLLGERVPDLPDATGTLLGLRPGSLDPGVLYRAALEGTSCNLAHGLARMRSVGISPSELRLVGGASANALWRQVLADVLEVPVRRLVEPESAALGAALQALWAVRGGDIEAVVAPFVCVEEGCTEPGHVDAYAPVRHRYGAALQRMHGVT